MIFLLGGNGFVGSGFARWCAANGRELVVLTRTNYADYVGKRCSIFVNANGNSKKPLAAQQPLFDFDASVRSVRASLVDFQFDQYVHLSSCDVYPDCSSPATTLEEQVLDPSQQSPYGFHKSLAEQCVRHGAKRHLICRLGGFVGPGLKKNAIFDIVWGEKLWLDPDSELQFMHTDDCARIIMGLAESGAATNRTLNVCGAGVVRLREVMAWAGRSPPVNPGSPKVRYEVATAALARLTDVPPTPTVARRFVEQAVR